MKAALIVIAFCTAIVTAIRGDLLGAVAAALFGLFLAGFLRRQ